MGFLLSLSRQVIEFFQKHTWIPFSVSLMLALFIYYISSLSFFGSSGSSISLIGVIYHVTVFMTLAFFFLIAVVRKPYSMKVFFFALFLLVFYSFLDELHQSFVVGRVSSISDFFLNCSGIFFASLLHQSILLAKD